MRDPRTAGPAVPPYTQTKPRAQAGWPTFDLPGNGRASQILQRDERSAVIVAELAHEVRHLEAGVAHRKFEADRRRKRHRVDHDLPVAVLVGGIQLIEFLQYGVRGPIEFVAE